jgi:hypothetical protein
MLLKITKGIKQIVTSGRAPAFGWSSIFPVDRHASYVRHLFVLSVLIPLLAPSFSKSASAESIQWTCNVDISNGDCAALNPQLRPYAGTIELKMLRILSRLSADHCVVTELSGNGDADVNDGFKIVHATLHVHDACTNELDGPRSVYQVKETRNQLYHLDCANTAYKFFVSGFSIGEDGKRLHWDSQGVGREIPWRPVTPKANWYVWPFYSVLCQ